MSHLKHIAAKLGEYHIDAMLCTSEPGERYAVGMHGEGCVIIAPGAARYLTDARYIELARDTVKDAQVRMVDRDHSAASQLNEFIDAHGIRTLGIEEGYLSVARYQRLQGDLHAQLVNAGGLVSTLRAGKDADELALMVEAQRITDETFSAMLDYIQPGMTEHHIAAKLVFEMMNRGAQKVSFDPIVASGPNGSMPHAIPGPRRVQKGDLITMDFGCVYGGYCSDMTRTIALGQVSDEQKKVYDTVLNAQLAGIAVSRAGVKGSDIHNAAARVIEEAGYGPYFGHGYGHSLGLEIHESPNASPSDHTPMPVGAMVSAEPGIYLPGRCGVRIEDVVRMEEGGCVDITHSPKELIVL